MKSSENTKRGIVHRRPGTVALALLITAGLFVFGCDETDEDKPEGGIDALTAATPGGTGPLTEAHSGWGQGECKTCHEKAHLDGFPLSACAHCHGTNGAPFKPEGHSDEGCSASGCHESVHAASAFSAPNDCRSCHTYAPRNPSADPCTHSESYDVVVIGGGGGGLAAATKLALEGENVLLLEQNYRTGGCMGTFQRGEFSFESSLHAMDGAATTVFAKLNIDDEITLKTAEVMYRTVYPDFSMDVPADIEEYRTSLKKEFPDQVEGIDAYIDTVANMNFSAFDDMSVSEAFVGLGITNERLIALLTVLSGFLAGGPDYLPANLYVAMLWGYHVTGYAYLEGGSGAIIDALTEEFEAAGGTLKTHSTATKIVIDNGRATQVRTDHGGCYSAGHVISNVNLPDTYLKMVGEENLPEETVDFVKTAEPAPSFATLYLGVDHDYTDLFPSGAHEIFIGTNYNTDYVAAVKSCDAKGIGLGIGNYTTLDPTNAPPGKNVIVISIPLAWECFDQWHWNDSYKDYNAFKADLAAQYIERAEEYLPDLSAHIEVMEMATPQTIAAYTMNPKGTWAAYGILPGMTGMEFLDKEAHRTPIGNLYMAGAWAGVAGQSVALNSGLQAAQLVLDAE